MEHRWQESIKLPVFADPSVVPDPDVLLDLLKRSHEVCIRDACLLHQGEIHCCLSGGLDSSLSLAIVRQLMPREVICTYTIGASPQHQDVVFAKRVAQHYNTRHSVIIPTEESIERARYQLVRTTGEAGLGSAGVYLFYEWLSRHGVRAVLAHDGIDELMGGYWLHRANEAAMPNVFRHYWQRLVPDHLEPLERKAASFGISVLLPYLDPHVVSYISHIPLECRTSRGESKKPLRVLARRLGVPEEIIQRRKYGFCDALNQELE
ncbi:MAG TPA: asparagine synthase C-terminal domain-containing protein [Patescibacteria group bacterium]|nr:asparagine synthase C-terminal domain-containing protein [Patescibacteria group bacterium]